MGIIEDFYNISQNFKKAVELFRNKDFDQAKMLAEDAIANAGSNPLLKIVTEFFSSLCEAYAIWDGTYDYNKIAHIIENSIKKIEEKKGEFSGDDSHYISALCALAKLVKLGTEYENSMIIEDSKKMKDISKKIFDLAGEGLEIIKKIPNWENKPFAQFLYHQFETRRTVNEAIQIFADLMVIKDKNPDEFLNRYNNHISTIEKAVKELMDKKDFEFGSELRAHYLNLKKHYEVISKSHKFLKLRNVSVYLIVGILIDEEVCGEVYEKIKNNKEDFIKKYRPLISLDEEEPSDLLASLFPSVDKEKDKGKNFLDNLLMIFEDASIIVHDKEYKVKVYSRLYRCGVCNIYLEFFIENIFPSELRVIQSLITPHTGQFKIKWNDKEYHYLTREDLEEPLLQDIYIKIKEIVGTCLKNNLELNKCHNNKNNLQSQKYTHQELNFYCYPHLNWFTYTYIREAYAVTNGKEEPVYDAREMVDCVDFNALVIAPREARSSIQDWVGIEKPQLNNLAIIRSHNCDLFIVDENHAVMYFPDDPEFIIHQYRQTVEMLVVLKTISNSFDKYVDKELYEIKNTNYLKLNLESLKLKKMQNIVDDINKFIMKINRNKIKFETVIELIKSPTVSQYRDHSILMQSMIKNTSIPATTERLYKKLEDINTVHDSISRIATIISQKLEKKSRKRIQTLLEIFNFIATVLAIDILFNTLKKVFGPKIFSDIVELIIIIILLIIILFTYFISGKYE